MAPQCHRRVPVQLDLGVGPNAANLSKSCSQEARIQPQISQVAQIFDEKPHLSKGMSLREIWLS